MSTDNVFSVGVLEIQANLYQHLLISVFHAFVENDCVILFLSFLACISENGNRWFSSSTGCSLSIQNQNVIIIF